ncbi:hypothetical protein CTA1_13104 [Colletotrichum tanaceti]|uniref:Uncharacterized protein n=1 Tax=Colletotrichum tanaceti TaxID=1306861 RepID=A0A4U6X1G5_9PEZI|nr:hypothetical protein CTA1_13104 [Colletotrichum tanaceti]
MHVNFHFLPSATKRPKASPEIDSSTFTSCTLSAGRAVGGRGAAGDVTRGAPGYLGGLVVFTDYLSLTSSLITNPDSVIALLVGNGLGHVALENLGFDTTKRDALLVGDEGRFHRHKQPARRPGARRVERPGARQAARQRQAAQQAARRAARRAALRVARLVEFLIARLVALLIARLVTPLVARLVEFLIARLVALLIARLVALLIARLVTPLVARRAARRGELQAARRLERPVERDAEPHLDVELDSICVPPIVREVVVEGVDGDRQENALVRVVKGVGLEQALVRRRPEKGARFRARGQVQGRRDLEGEVVPIVRGELDVGNFFAAGRGRVVGRVRGRPARRIRFVGVVRVVLIGVVRVDLFWVLRVAPIVRIAEGCAILVVGRAGVPVNVVPVVHGYSVVDAVKVAGPAFARA